MLFRSHQAFEAPSTKHEKAVVSEIRDRFVSTGATVSGRTDRDGSYDASVDETGYRVKEIALRTSSQVLTVWLDSRSLPEQFFPVIGLFAKRKRPMLQTGDNIDIVRTDKTVELVVGGKSYKAKLVSERLASPPPSPEVRSQEEAAAALIRKLREQFAQDPVVFLQKRFKL